MNLITKIKPQRSIWYLLFITTTILTACGDSKSHHSVPTPLPPPSVITQKIIPMDMDISSEYRGRATASQEVEVNVRVNGIILKRNYTEGQYVELDEVLAELESDSYRADFHKAEARFNQVERNWQRVFKLYEDGVASGSEFDAAKAEYEQAKSELWKAQINLDYTKVKAPISGIAGKENFSTGNLVQPGSITSILTTIKKIDPIYVNFSYSDKEFLSLQNSILQGDLIVSPKLKANVHLQEGLRHPYEGYTDFTDSSIDSQTGSVKARAVIPNPQSTLLPGQFIKLSIQGIVKHNAIVVPERSIIQGPHGPFVYTISSDGKAVVQPVTLGSLTKEGFIVESGLQAGDQIIIDGMIKVIPGQLVKIEALQQADNGIANKCNHCSHCNKNK